MSLKNSLVVLWVYIMYVLGLWIFLSGYLLKRIVVHKNSTHFIDDSTQPNCLEITLLQNIMHSFSDSHSSHLYVQHLKKFDKAIILIIDALRYDFVCKSALDEYYTNKMPVFEESVKNHSDRALLFHSMADPPTTTLQRLKGITTGSLPTFIDASWNFASPEIDEDNLIWRLIESGKRIVFMGDDTWESLFPSHFHRSFPFPSFNVKDLDTVDDGILLHLYEEMGRNDSDVIIAHFLGVDHCGHRYGPKHPEMTRKLIQMNNAIVKVIQNLQNDTLLVVMGDHGMTATGDHGGDSQQELSTTLFMYSKETSFGIPKNGETEISQIDIVPTLALLLGIPIPFPNLGVVIDAAFSIKCFNNELDSIVAKILALHTNVLQVRQYLISYSEISDEFSDSFIKISEDMLNYVNKLWQSAGNNINDNQEIFHKILEEYKKYLAYVHETCKEKWATFNIEYMIFGSSILGFTICFNFWIAIKLDFKYYFVIVSEIIILSFFITLYFFNLFSFLLWLLSMISIIIISCRLKKAAENFAFSWSTFLNIPVVAMVTFFLSSFSNSFVIYEDCVVLYFLQGLIVYRFFPLLMVSLQPLFSFTTNKIAKTTKSNQKNSWKWILLPLCFVCLIVCIRFGTVFRKCREEQVICETTDFIVSLEKIYRDQSYKAVRLVISLVSLVLPVAIYLGMLCKKLFIKENSVSAVCVKYAIFFISVLICLRWWLNIVSPSVVEKILKGNEIVFPRAAFLLCCILCFGIFIFPILPEKPWEIPSKDVYGGSCVSFLIIVLQLIFLIGGDALSTSNSLMSFSILFYIILLHSTVVPGSNIMDSLNTDESQIWTDVIIWSFLSRHWFYSSAHQATFSSIYWDAAFLLDNEVHSYILSGTLVLIGTFSSYIFMGAALPLLLVWSQSAFTSNALLRIHMKYLFCFGIKLLATIGASFLLRRHLMVWKIFTPKLIYEVLAVLVTMVSSSLSCLFLLRTSSQYHRSIRKNLSYMFSSKDE